MQTSSRSNGWRQRVGVQHQCSYTDNESESNTNGLVQPLSASAGEYIDEAASAAALVEGCTPDAARACEASERTRTAGRERRTCLLSRLHGMRKTAEWRNPTVTRREVEGAVQRQEEEGELAKHAGISTAGASSLLSQPSIT